MAVHRRNLAQQRQQQADRQLRDGRVEHARRIGDHHAMLARRRQWNRVVADARGGDDAQRRQTLEPGRRDGIPAARDDRADPAGERRVARQVRLDVALQLRVDRLLQLGREFADPQHMGTFRPAHRGSRSLAPACRLAARRKSKSTPSSACVTVCRNSLR